MESAITLTLSHEAASLLLEILSAARGEEADALRDVVTAGLTATQNPLEAAAEERARDKLAQDSRRRKTNLQHC